MYGLAGGFTAHGGCECVLYGHNDREYGPGDGTGASNGLLAWQYVRASDSKCVRDQRGSLSAHDSNWSPAVVAANLAGAGHYAFSNDARKALWGAGTV